MSNNRWLPLESNPEVMNKYLDTLGVKKCWQFVDVYGFDELLQMIPRPACALIFLYPIHENTREFDSGSLVKDSGLYFIRQTIHNACGTIAIIHALCNNADKLGFDMDKHMNKFFEDTKDMSPEERGKYLESDSTFIEVHDVHANDGQTKAPSPDDHIDLHFVAFLHHKGSLYELDGRKEGPICHGVTAEETFIEDAADVIKKFIGNNKENLSCSAVCLSNVQD